MRNRKKLPYIANETNSTLIWYAFYDLRPGKGVGSILTAPETTQRSRSVIR